MSQSQFVSYRKNGFWAYDVALGIFLKHLIDVAEPPSLATEDSWLHEAIADWRVIAVISDYALTFDETWSPTQTQLFIALANQACSKLAERDHIDADEITSWPILQSQHIFTRGATKVSTAPIVELGRAIVDLVSGSLSKSPADTCWLFGTPNGRTTIRTS